MSPEEILDALDPEQREVARALDGPVRVLAGAGTGKTRAMTHRIAYGVRVSAYDPHAVLAVTFTARAAGEMRERLRLLGVPDASAKTFHAAALHQLRYFWPEVIGGSMPPIVEQKGALVAKAARSLGMQVDRLALRDLAAEIEWAKVSLVAPADYPGTSEAGGRPAPAGFARGAVADLMRAYEQAKTDDAVLDFEDLLLLLADILDRNREAGDVIRRRFRHFVVDEYQDVSPLQQYLLERWLGGRDDLCVVGDPSQTIYSFAGASPRYLLAFGSVYPHATEVRLVRDYRSTPQVVSLANRIVGAGGETVQLIAQRPPGPDIAYRIHADDADEASAIGDRIAALIASGVAARDVAILYRTNGQTEAFEEALATRGIGYVVRGAARFFDREEVRRGVLALRAAAVTDGGPGGDVAVAVREALLGVGWAEDPPSARGAVRERWDSLQAIVALADVWDGTLREFIAHLDERADAQHAPVVDGVTLSTLHASKGLEWLAVFIAGVSEGLIPISLAETDEAIAEEKRLLYVGITRAREHLTLSYARSRNPGGRAVRKRTRFLDRVWPDARPPAAPPTPRPAADDLAVGDLALFETLKAWRLAHAQADGKPAFTVLVDTTLAEIARRKPRTRRELGEVRGMGPSKLDRFGLEILEMVGAHGGGGHRAAGRQGTSR